MTRKVVSILSLARSGSTMMDVLLGSHPRFVGIGAGYSFVNDWKGILDRPEEELCSCRETISDCPFWGPTWQAVREIRHRPLLERDLLLLDRCAEYFGPERIVVDGSKREAHVEMCHQAPEIDQKVLFMIKDVRLWVISNIENLRRQDALNLSGMIRTYGLRKPRNYFNRAPIKIFLAWYRANRRIRNWLRRENIDHFQLGYDELALYPDYMLDQIFNYLQVERSDRDLSLRDTVSHSILGNQMRFEPEKREGVYYDNRWFKRREWVLPSLLFPSIMAFNTREVYRNTSRRYFWR